MENQELTSIRILIADDDKVIAEVLRDVLASPERIIEICHDGQAAADKIQADGFDLVLVDLVMPKLGGLDVLKIAKQVNPDVIVIIVTGYASLETAVSAIKEGAYDYVMKPCKLDEFKIVIDRATEKIKLNKENKELLKKLQDASQELTQLHEKKNNHHKEALKFFSSNKAWMHSLYDDARANFIDKLQALAYLRESGMLTQEEFTQFKSLYLKSIRTTV